MKKVILSSAAALMLSVSVGTFAGIQGSGSPVNAGNGGLAWLLVIEGSGLQAIDLLRIVYVNLSFVH